MSDLARQLIAENKRTRAPFLDLGDCGLRELPTELFELSWLQHLNLGLWFLKDGEWQSSANGQVINRLQMASVEGLDRLTGLVGLYLSGNQSINIEALTKLSQLQTLDLSATSINKIEALAKLSQLQTLYLSSTSISDIEMLANLSQLHTLNLSSNRIVNIEILAKLPQLKIINLSQTEVSNIEVLSKLPQLHTLDLSNNPISNIDILANLSRLHTLNLNNTHISDIEVLAKLPQLHTLSLNKTHIRDIEVLAKLPQLQRLHLRNIRLASISALSQLPLLQELDISENGLSYIGALEPLVNLERLDIGDNAIHDISPLSRLTQLQHLNLGSTIISDLSVLPQLPQLVSLDLSHTRVQDIGVLASLHQLQTIHFVRNVVPNADVFAQLPALTTLNLKGSDLQDLSPLRPLIERGLPVYVDNDNNTAYDGSPGIFIAWCPILTPPPEIIEQGNEAILNFFRQVDEQGDTVPLYEARTILVGEPGAGKTSLTEKLFDEAHQVIANDPAKKPTHGINVRPDWQFPDCERQGETFTAHIWDFGGQEIQYMTHQFFLTPESLYVLVADDRKQHTLFPYWFEVIQLLGKDERGKQSPVLVVLNERSHKSISNFDLVAYREKYPDLRIEMLEVDLSDTNLNRFRAIRDKIQQLLCTLDHVGRPLPRMWAPIRQVILDRSRQQNHLTEAEFADICAQHNVTRPEDRALISTYLHRLGAILHFQDDMQLRDFLIIDPSWALKAVYAVLEDKQVAQQQGRFSEIDLDRYWYDLTNSERGKILSLMKRDNFEICYPVGNRTYIAPQLLSQVRPDFDWDSRGSLKCQFFYRFMPKGIMTRLIVRKHESLADDKRVWARGAVFSYADCDILVTEEETERNGLIAIEVDGSTHINRIRALNFIRDEIDAIHSKWFRNIECEERAPCICDDCRDSPKPTFFPWATLVQCVDQDRQQIPCFNGPIKDVAVMSLLEGVYDQDRISRLLSERRRRTAPEHPPLKLTPETTERAQPPSPSETSPVPRPPEPTLPELPTPSEPMKTTNWLPAVLVAAVIALAFFLFARPGSKLDFFGWFKAEQGQAENKPATDATPANVVPSTATVIGTIRINNQSARQEQIRYVSIKGETAGPRASLDNDAFRLREVRIPTDRLITIAIELVTGEQVSQLFNVPEPNQKGVIDLGEVLLTVNYPKPSRRTAAGKASPTIIINNQNVQK